MIPVAENNKIYEFADFRLIPSEGLLLHHGIPVSLNPKAFAVLSLLVGRHGHLIPKSEIIDTIWEDAFIEEGAISKSIWFIRAALGDTSKEKFIQTIPRRGYRFVAPVTVLNVGSGSFAGPVSTGYRLADLEQAIGSGLEVSKIVELPVVANGKDNGLSPESNGTGHLDHKVDTPKLQVLRPWYRSAWVWAAGIVFLSALIGSGYFIYAPTTADANVKKLAILPLKPMDPANRNTLYEVGIADSLINRLSSAKGFIVRSVSSVGKYNETDHDPVSVGREQKVDFVLASNYQIADGKIRITSQLLNVATGRVEDQYKFEKEASSIFAVQDSVAADFAGKLMARFNVSPGGPAKGRGTDNEEAYRLYIHGTHIYHRLNTSKEAPRAVEVLKEVVALDPNFAQAWASLALAYVTRSTSRSKDGSERQAAADAVNSALAIDANLSEAHTAECFVETILEFNLGAAEPACARALELDPNSGDAHAHYATVLGALGRHDEGLREIKSAIDIEPTSARFQRRFGNALFRAHRFDEAAEQYKRCIELEPRADYSYLSVMRTLEAQGKDAEAFEYLIKALTIRGKDEAAIESYRAVFREAGWRGVLVERIRTGDVQSPYDTARMYATIGDRDKAFEWLERAYQERIWELLFIETEPSFGPVHDDPRYVDLVRRVKGK